MSSHSVCIKSGVCPYGNEYSEIGGAFFLMGGNDVWIRAWIWSHSQLKRGWFPPPGLDSVKTNLVRSGCSSTSRKHLPSSEPNVWVGRGAVFCSGLAPLTHACSEPRNQRSNKARDGLCTGCTDLFQILPMQLGFWQGIPTSLQVHSAVCSLMALVS